MAIIFADDDDFVREISEELLSGLSDKVLLCEDGNQAVSTYKANTGAKLVILDLNMPNKDGFEAAKEIRAAGFKGNIVGFSAGNFL